MLSCCICFIMVLWNQTHNISNMCLPSTVVLCLVTQSCPTLCDLMECSLPGSSVHGDSPSKNTGMGCHFLLQGLNPGLMHSRQSLYCLSHQGRKFYFLELKEDLPSSVSLMLSSAFIVLFSFLEILFICTFHVHFWF